MSFQSKVCVSGGFCRSSFNSDADYINALVLTLVRCESERACMLELLGNLKRYAVKSCEIEREHSIFGISNKPLNELTQYLIELYDEQVLAYESYYNIKEGK